MFQRQPLLNEIRVALANSRVMALLGPRQCGKTTLALNIVPVGSLNYFDLEDVRDLSRLEEPFTALESLTGTVVIDEVQRRPELFPTLRVLADRMPTPAKFLVLGSSSPELLQQSSESLAGRLQRVQMGGFSLGEIPSNERNVHWLRGGFPLSFLSTGDEESFVWRREFIQTFLERDVRQIVNVLSATLGRFWAMLAHYHGQIWNASELARAMSIHESTVRRYLDLLSDLFMVRQLPAWHANLSKRQVRAPKIYFRDSGLLHQLLGIHSARDLHTHPKVGASWEGYALEEIIRAVKPDESFFWATHQGAEIDLLLMKDGKLWGVEFKNGDMPKATPSMRTALAELGLERIAVVYPGSRRVPLHDKIEAVPITEIPQGMAGLFP
ncbi:MAG: ATP-binding protein [Puniceicoccales bacterium]|nr:ATP-binding protein [Puniceicoccales bacterium]